MNEDSPKNKSFRPVYRPPMPPSSTTVSIGRKALPFPTAKAIFWITFWFWVSTSITYSGMRLFEWSRETHYGASALQMIFKVLTEATALLILFAFIGVIVVMPLVLLLKNRPFWWKESVTCTLVTLAVGVIIGIPVIENYVTLISSRKSPQESTRSTGSPLPGQCTSRTWLNRSPRFSSCRWASA